MLPGTTSRSFKKWNLLTVAAVVLVLAGILVLSVTFHHSHGYLHHAVTVHSQACGRLHVDEEGDWSMIYQLAIQSANRMDFIQQLRTEGYMHVHGPSSASNYVTGRTIPAGSSSTAQEEQLDDVASHWTRRGANKSPAGRAGNLRGGVVAGGGSGGSDAVSKGVLKHGQDDDYKAGMNVYENGPHDVLPEDEDSGNRESDGEIGEGEAQNGSNKGVKPGAT